MLRLSLCVEDFTLQLNRHLVAGGFFWVFEMADRLELLKKYLDSSPPRQNGVRRDFGLRAVQPFVVWEKAGNQVRSSGNPAHFHKCVMSNRVI